ncbi:MAG: DNA-formamidopyrimidine glycosylase [Gammaproteobacteria bacterium]|nr:MAG: DNA-formamidopyrimidine glycosylase [Gammaproteobacteria bacterium]
MPELPEVETTVQGLKHHIEGCRIEKVTFHRPDIRYPLEPHWIGAIEGQTISAIRRRAKLIIITLDNAYLVWHLGMTGSLRISQPEELMRKHDHVELQLNNRRAIRFHDPRRFGYLNYFADTDSLNEHLSRYGVEPLSNAFNGAYLWRRSRNKKQPVKNFIMDQTVVVGVGNIYACEALFAAGIRPQRACGKISRAHYDNLIKHIKNILRQAIKQGGTTLKDFENADAEPGYFQQSLAVYGREGQPCAACATAIKKIKLGGRSSFYCPKCQR